MGWTVVLEDENRSKISSLEISFISPDIFDDLKNNTFHLVKYLGPYGDTIFNQRQMTDLIDDLKKMQALGCNEDVEKIIQLAFKCKIEVHTYLVFYGD